MFIFFHIPDFSRALKVYKTIPTLVLLIHKSIIWGGKRLGTTYIHIVDNTSKNKNIHNLIENFCSWHDKLIILLNSPVRMSHKQ